MWTRRLPAFSALLLGCVSVGCGDDSTATGSATDPATTSTGDTTPTSDPGTTVGVTTGGTSTGDTGVGGTDSDAGTTEPVGGSTGSSTGAVTEATTTTTGDTTGDTTSDTGDTSTSDTGDTSTGDTGDTTGDTGDTDGAICGVDGPRIDALLLHGDGDPGCGTLEFSGQLVGSGEGPFYELDGCACNAACESPDPWTLFIDVPSPFDLPVWMPECPHIVVQRQMSKQGCELVGVSILQDGDPPGDLGLWHAGSLLGPIDAIADVWQIEALPVETCECDTCCDAPTRFDLKFSAAGESVTIPEGGEDHLEADAAAYPIKSYQSHHSGLCDASPEIDWVIHTGIIPPLSDGMAASSDMSSRP